MEVGVTGFVIGVIVEAIERWHSSMIYWQVVREVVKKNNGYFTVRLIEQETLCALPFISYPLPTN